MELHGVESSSTVDGGHEGKCVAATAEMSESCSLEVNAIEDEPIHFLRPDLQVPGETRR